MSSIRHSAGRLISIGGLIASLGLVPLMSAPSSAAHYPNDPLFVQGGVNNLITNGQWNMRKVRAPEAWHEVTGSGIKVAILDTGIDLDHPDLNCGTKITTVAGWTAADNNGHGTHVAGIVGACTNNGVGVAGIAPDAKLLPLQVLFTGSTTATVANAIIDATNAGAHVINMSIGFTIAGIPATGSAFGLVGGFANIDAAIDYAVSQGVVVVAAAGNEGSPLCGYPAIAFNVICVGATDPRDVKSWYGNLPIKDDDDELLGPSLSAPGGTGHQVFCDLSSQEILSTWDTAFEGTNCDGLVGYESVAGTSMASPLVAGAAALVYEDIGGVRNLTNRNKVVKALIDSAVDLGPLDWDPIYGHGRLDAAAAVAVWP